MNTTTLADIWATRPVRRRPAKWAGVCAGFGARYNVDPTLIRVAFVIATIFGGAGVLLYLAAIIALPSERSASHDDHEHKTPGNLGLSTGKLVVLVILAVIAVASFGGGRAWNGGGLLGTALLLVGWWLLYQRTPVAPAGTSAKEHESGAHLPGYPPQGPVYPPVYPPTATPAAPAHYGAPGTPQAEQPASSSTAPMAAAGASAATAPTSGSGVPTPESGVATSESGAPTSTPSTPASSPGDPTSSPTEADSPSLEPVERAQTPLLIDSPPTPPAWDPLGVAPFAWDLPEPPVQTPPPSPTAPRSPITPVTTGLAVLVGVAGAALHAMGVDWFTTGRIASMVLLVLGAGLVIAGLRRRPEGAHSSGLLPLGMLAAAVVIVASLVSSTGWKAPAGGIGERTWTPTEQSQLRDDYQLSVGNTILDLRQLPSLERDQTVNINQGIGQIEIFLPENVRVRAECSVGIGDFNCPEGVVGDGDGPVLTINARTGMGNVEMSK